MIRKLLGLGLIVLLSEAFAHGQPRGRSDLKVISNTKPYQLSVGLTVGLPPANPFRNIPTHPKRLPSGFNLNGFWNDKISWEFRALTSHNGYGINFSSARHVPPILASCFNWFFSQGDTDFKDISFHYYYGVGAGYGRWGANSTSFARIGDHQIYLGVNGVMGISFIKDKPLRIKGEWVPSLNVFDSSSSIRHLYFIKLEVILAGSSSAES